MKATLILCDGTQGTVVIKSFENVKKLICYQGYMSPLEIIYITNNRAILIDEEGKLKNLSINQTATALAHEEDAIYPSDFICGDVILIEDMDEFDALPYV